MTRAMIALVLVACGGGSSSSPGPAGPPPAPGKVEARAADDEFTVTVGDKVLARRPAEQDRYDLVTGDVFEVEGSGGRVWLAQWFGEQGEDELSRDIEAWLIDASRGEVLWTGKAQFVNSFDACHVWKDIPEPSFAGGVVTITLASGVEILEEGTDRCEGSPLARREGAKITLK